MNTQNTIRIFRTLIVVSFFCILSPNLSYSQSVRFIPKSKSVNLRKGSVVKVAVQNGRNLDEIGKIIVMRGNNPAKGIRAALPQKWPKNREITFKADLKAKAGTYTIRLINRQNKVIKAIPEKVFRIFVTDLKPAAHKALGARIPPEQGGLSDEKTTSSASQKATAITKGARYSIKNKPPTIPTQRYLQLLQKIQKNPEHVTSPKVGREIKEDSKRTLSKHKELDRTLNLRPGDKKTAKQISSMIFKNKSSAEMKKSWMVFIETIVSENKPIDITALIQWVLIETSLEQKGALEVAADYIKAIVAANEAIRDQMRIMRANQSTPVRSKIVRKNSKGNIVVEQGAMLSNREEIDEHIKDMEEALNTVGDDAQQANIDLQNMLKKQQQTIQLISNASKVLHDTAMSVIRKIG